MKIRKIIDIPDGYYKKLALAESSGNPNARAFKIDEKGNKKFIGTASGMFQFTESTWKEMVKKMGKEYSLEDRFDKNKALEVTKYFTEKNENYLKKKLGRDPNEAELYLAHFSGMGGASKLLQKLEENPNADSSIVYSAKAIKNNPHLKGKKLYEIYNWAAKKFSVGKYENEKSAEKSNVKYKEPFIETPIDNTYVSKNPVKYVDIKNKTFNEKPLKEENIRSILQEEKNNNIKVREHNFLNAFNKKPQQNLNNYQPPIQENINYLYNYIKLED